MNNYGLIFIALFACLMRMSGVYALQCYTCIPILQTGEDCSRVNSAQLQQCRNEEDICRVTSVTLPIAGIAQSTVVPTINRGCFRSSDLNAGIGNANALLPRSSNCQSYTENQRVSRTCRCDYDGCNSWSPQQLANNDLNTDMRSGTGYYNSGMTVSAPHSHIMLGLSIIFINIVLTQYRSSV